MRGAFGLSSLTVAILVRGVTSRWSLPPIPLNAGVVVYRVDSQGSRDPMERVRISREEVAVPISGRQGPDLPHL